MKLAIIFMILIPANILVGVILYQQIKEINASKESNVISQEKMEKPEQITKVVSENQPEEQEENSQDTLEEDNLKESSEAKEEETVEENTELEPLESFEIILHNEIEPFYKNYGTVIENLRNEWVKVQMFPSSDFRYDVQKTDSLVSPYVAVVEFDLIQNYTVGHKTREDAISDENYAFNKQFSRKLNFSWQGGRWIAKSEERYSEILDEWVECTLSCYPLEY